MRFSWSEEQQLLRSTLQRYVSDRHDFSRRQHRKPDVAWAEIAELGLLGLPFGAEYGGADGTALETLIVMEGFGRGLVDEPYLATVVLAGGLLRYAANKAQKEKYIPPLVRGELRLAVAFAEQGARFNLAHVETSAVACDGGYVLSGAKIVVFDAPDSDALLVTARTSGSTSEQCGISLFLVPANAVGLAQRPCDTIGGIRASEVSFEDVSVAADCLIGELDEAYPLLARVVDEATVAACAEAVGMIEALNDRCVEYAKTRVVFGQPLSKFQILQHRLVDMRGAYEQAAAITLKAAIALDLPAATRGRAVSACKVQVAQEAAFVGKNAVQIHGAIGMTDELDVGHYFKRLVLFQASFGNADHHLRRYISLQDAALSRH
ncbi:acyl-CoA dehydrogenase family protein [Bradyrhizobium liaoningense]